MNEKITVDKFLEIAPQRLSFLEAKGFMRRKSIEDSTPTYSTIVYIGKNIGFVFSFDVRDQCIDGEVVRVKSGQLIPSSEGGYSSDIFSHLVRHEGYRGSPSGKGNHDVQTVYANRLEQMIDSWAGLLKSAGNNLLSDKLEALP